MHDTEPDTFVPSTIPEDISAKLAALGISSSPNKISEGEAEKGEYYSRYFTNAPRMITNRGSLEVSGSNIDAVHIVQKG